jgi:carboxyl-terminal processing protease
MDTGRGEVVGERTYGNAAERETIKLDDGAALVLSVAKYYTPAGKAMQDEGMTPSVPLDPADLRRYRDQMFSRETDMDEPAAPPAPGSGEDPFVKKALEVLKNGAGALKKAA